ncbi:MAG TPA: hypothetical protein VGE36_20225 [Roseateles sp.]
MIKQVIALVAASGLAAKLVQQLIQRPQTQRGRDEGRRHRDEVNRWEAEGGNLPPAPPWPAAAPRRRAAAKTARTAKKPAAGG